MTMQITIVNHDKARTAKVFYEDGSFDKPTMRSAAWTLGPNAEAEGMTPRIPTDEA